MLLLRRMAPWLWCRGVVTQAPRQAKSGSQSRRAQQGKRGVCMGRVLTRGGVFQEYFFLPWRAAEASHIECCFLALRAAFSGAAPAGGVSPP